MRRHLRLPFLAALLFGASSPGLEARAAPTETAGPAAPSPLRLAVTRHRLDNGLRVVLSVDHGAPTVAIDVAYDVGARHEERGRTGFARLLEHLMSEGSSNVARGEHARLVASRGGAVSSNAGADQTSYVDRLPAGELGLGLWLEADRMKSLAIAQGSLELQRTVVRDEHRAQVAGAYAAAALRLQELCFQGYWPYEHPALGAPRDLATAQLASVRAFHEAYYTPNNAVLAVAGDFDESEALGLIRRYFGEARAGAPVVPPARAEVPEQTAARAAIVEDADATLPALLLGWVIGASDDPDHPALELTAMLLGDGDSSRLARALARERPVARGAGARTLQHRGPDLFTIEVKLTSDARSADVLRRVEDQIADVARRGCTDDELSRLRARIRARLLADLESNLGRAQRLADLELSRGDAALVNAELDRYLAVSKDDLRRVAARYLLPSRRSLVEVKPGEKR